MKSRKQTKQLKDREICYLHCPSLLVDFSQASWFIQNFSLRAPRFIVSCSCSDLRFHPNIRFLVRFLVLASFFTSWLSNEFLQFIQIFLLCFLIFFRFSFRFCFSSCWCGLFATSSSIEQCSWQVFFFSSFSFSTQIERSSLPLPSLWFWSAACLCLLDSACWFSLFQSSLRCFCCVSLARIVDKSSFPSPSLFVWLLVPHAFSLSFSADSLGSFFFLSLCVLCLLRAWQDSRDERGGLAVSSGWPARREAGAARGAQTSLRSL